MGQLRVGMVGYAFMGAAHSQAWRTVNRAFDLPLRPGWRWSAAATRRRSRAAAAQLGWDGHTTDWRDADRPGRHRPGRHLHAGRQPRRDRAGRARRRQARALREAAGQHGGRGPGDGRGRGRRRRPRGVRSMCGFNYRRVPGGGADAPARRGRAGSARSGTSARSTCRTGSSTRSSRWSGGCSRTVAGSGALGDIGAHIVDLTQYVTGQPITGGQRADRDVRQGAAAAGRVERAGGRRGNGGRAPGQVTVDDAALFLARLDGGAVATYEATRFATGRKNGLRVEINGSLGSAGVRLRADERAGVLRRHAARPPSRASAGSW